MWRKIGDMWYREGQITREEEIADDLKDLSFTFHMVRSMTSLNDVLMLTTGKMAVALEQIVVIKQITRCLHRENRESNEMVAIYLNSIRACSRLDIPFFVLRPEEKEIVYDNREQVLIWRDYFCIAAGGAYRGEDCVMRSGFYNINSVDRILYRPLRATACASRIKLLRERRKNKGV